MELQSPANTADANFISALESSFIESLHIQDDQESENAMEGNYNSDAVECLCGDFELQDMELSKKCLGRCATFPDPDIMLPPSFSDAEDEKANNMSLTESLSKKSTHQAYSRSISLPVSPPCSKYVHINLVKQKWW